MAPAPTVEEVVRPLIAGFGMLEQLRQSADRYELRISFGESRGGATSEERADAQRTVDVVRDAAELIATWVQFHRTERQLEVYRAARHLVEDFVGDDVDKARRMLAFDRCEAEMLPSGPQASRRPVAAARRRSR